MLTSAQMKCLTFLDAEISRTGVCPSYRTIADHLGYVAVSNVHHLIHGLKKRGFLKLKPRCSRSVQIIKRPAHLQARYFLVTPEIIQAGRDALTTLGKADFLNGEIEMLYAAMRRAEETI